MAMQPAKASIRRTLFGQNTQGSASSEPAASHCHHNGSNDCICKQRTPAAKARIFRRIPQSSRKPGLSASHIRKNGMPSHLLWLAASVSLPEANAIRPSLLSAKVSRIMNACAGT